MINKIFIIPTITIFLVFVAVFFVSPSDVFACHGYASYLHRDHISSNVQWKSSGVDAEIGQWGPNGSDAGSYDNIIFINLEPGRYEVNTHGQYGRQTDEHMVVVASDGDMDTIPDLDGSAGGSIWLWGQGTVDLYEQNGSITIRAYSQVPNAVCSLTVDEVIIERIGEAGGLAPIVASCSVSPTTADVGENVTWTANASGGDGIHNYTWSGDVSGTAVKTSQDQALEFDAVDDSVDLGTDSSLLPDAWTVSAWVKPTDTAGEKEHALVTFSRMSPRPVIFLDFKQKPLIYMGSSNYQYFDAAAYTTLINGGWHHVAFTMPGNSQNDISNAQMYLDGVSVAKDAISKTAGQNAKEGLLIGRSSLSAPNENFKGLIDDVRVYNRVLSSSEISDLYNSIPVSNNGLVGHWEFDEGSGTIANDSSGNGNTGTLINGPQWVAGNNSNTSYFVDTSYSTVGTKTAQVNVTSGSQEETVSCSNSVAIGSQCSNGGDDDGDGFVDALDAGCYTTGSYDIDDNTEINELPQCSNFFDDDTDTFVDFDDMDCFEDLIYDPNDNDESTTIPPVYQCSDGVNNDSAEDSYIDAADPGCYTSGSYNPNDDDETDDGLLQCANFFDDDGDGLVDLADPGCSSADDAQELNIIFEEA